jgi:hypothetical protein
MEKQNASQTYELQEVEVDKISGIIPQSHRVSSVDMKDAAPIRPGMPSFGRPQGVSSLNKGPNVAALGDTASKAMVEHEELSGWKAADKAKADAVQSVSNSFFMKNTKEAEPVNDIEPVRLIPVDQMPARSKPAGFKSEIGSMKSEMGAIASFEDGFEGEPELQQPEGLFPKGSFIDRTA